MLLIATMLQNSEIPGAAFGGRMASRATLRRTLTKELQILAKSDRQVLVDLRVVGRGYEL